MIARIEEKFRRIITEKLQQFGGGEEYFSALDAELTKTNNFDIVSLLFEYPASNVVVSGRFGNFIARVHSLGGFRFDSLLVFNGGLRKGDAPILQHGYRLKMHSEPVAYTFFDDSFYMGRTALAIDKVLRSTYNGYIRNIRVAYDGSPEKRENVSSIFRYHN